MGESSARTADRNGGRAHEVLAGLLLFILAGLFLGAAAVRRLNFDEALALRSGWLLLGHIPAAPPFCMPFTLALGSLARTLDDPGTVLLAARLAVAAVVLAALVGSLVRISGVRLASLATVLTLMQAAFFVHGLEFRYDAALLVALLVAWVCLVKATAADFAVLGASVTWLAAHHLKGVFLALAIYLFALVRARRDRRRLVRLHGGAGAVLAAWLIVLLALRLVPEASAVYTSFLGVALRTEIRLWPWESLGDAFGRDAVWWMAAVAAGAWTARKLARSEPSKRQSSPELWAAALAAVSLGFQLFHPHPWAYMLALPAPFLAFLMALAWKEAQARTRALVAVALAAVLGAQAPAGRRLPGSVLAPSFEASRQPQVDALRLLRRLAKPNEKTLDPSGLAYFLPPCTPEWYIDSLFREGARKGVWMNSMKSLDAAECPWLVSTYRLEMFPYVVKARISAGYVLKPGGLGLARGDERLRRPELWPSTGPLVLESFW